VSIGPFVKRDPVVGRWDVVDKFRLDGVISVDDFGQQPFTFDFTTKAVVLVTPKTLAQRRAAGKSSPLQFGDGHGMALDLFAQFLVGNQHGQCEIDTGSPRATVSIRFMKSLGIEKDGKDVQNKKVAVLRGLSKPATTPSCHGSRSPLCHRSSLRAPPYLSSTSSTIALLESILGPARCSLSTPPAGS